MRITLSRISLCSIVLCCIAALTGCSSDETILPEEQPVHTPAGAYEEDCKWIYSMMNHYYLWREDMPDSISCDYGTDPVTFYKSLISPKDRFSYCENNTSYVPPREETEKNMGYAYSDTIEAIDIFGPAKTVFLDSVYNISNHKIGYLCYLQFDDIDELVPVMKRFYEKRIDDLVLDLRYNPGGYVNTCKYLSNSIINESGYNQIFQQCTYNDILTREYETTTGSGISINMFSTPTNGNNGLGTPMYGLNLKRLYVLTSKYSASASEAAIISMRPFMEVIIIGEQTYGKGVGSWTIYDNRFKYQLQPITMRYHNAVMETTPDEGIPADYYVADGYYTDKANIGKTGEPLLAKALELILENKKYIK